MRGLPSSMEHVLTRSPQPPLPDGPIVVADECINSCKRVFYKPRGMSLRMFPTKTGTGLEVPPSLAIGALRSMG